MVTGKNSVFGETNIIKNKPLVISSHTLQIEYEKNEVSADQKFKGKLLAVKGQVMSLNKSISNQIVISLFGGSNMFMPPKAFMTNGYENWVASLNKGNVISLVCKGDGRLLGSAIMNNCVSSYDWSIEATKSIIEATPEGIKGNNVYLVKFVELAKNITPKLKSDSKCFTNGTNEECLEEISTMADNIKKSDLINTGNVQKN